MKHGDLIAKRYRLEHELGRGGMAEVWRATDVRLNRPAAVKFLAPEFSEDPGFLVRFFNEAQSVASLNHINVVSVRDFGDFEGRPYLVMEYVPGGSLADLVGESVLPERALELIEAAARGAGAAHHLGIVHRDLKPANILLDDVGRPKLADFGIAASRGGERMTATGDAIGSPHYISPEQVSGGVATPASDVYSLGIVLYQLLTGVRPFEHDNITAVAVAHVDSDPEPPSAHVDDLDPALDALVLRCLAKDPEDRFADGDELADSIASGDYREDATAFMLVDDGSHRLGGRGSRRAVAIGAAAALGVAALALAGVLLLGGGEDESTPAERQQTTTKEVKEKKDKPKPSVEPSTEEVTTTSTEPSAAPPEPDEKQAPAKKDPAPGGDDEDAEEPEPEPEPEPTTEPEPEPEPDPTAEPEPTTEPSPDP